MTLEEEIKSRLSYNPDTGIFIWIKAPSTLEFGSRIYNSWVSRCVGKRAGYEYKKKEDKTHYRAITFNGEKIKEHRLAFIIMTGKWPEQYVDHLDGNGTNNKWKNLREVSTSESAKNMPKKSNNTSGKMGVIWCEPRKKWLAQIIIDRKNIKLGAFIKYEDAVKAREDGEILYGFHENHGR